MFSTQINPNELTSTNVSQSGCSNLLETTSSITVPQNEKIPEPELSSQSNMLHSGDLMCPLKPEIIESLCQIVTSPRTTETARNWAFHLITDLARASKSMQLLMLKLLRSATAQLLPIISKQLDVSSDIS
ncbi:unnamed protein product [Protopolystoma xenopodis]|uniref:Uncharacterized protein n=1 Tax=Protopolystoma xenopodis TaxID=117903 RepID=A0A448WQJ1_9PLAT|nr:unnamed protein product [Protopolystoma xenopodis]